MFMYHNFHFQCFPEIIALFTMGHIVKFFGETLCLYSVCWAYALRFFGYSLLERPWFVLLIEPLHLFCYGIMYGAASSYASRITPQGMHGTVQAILGTACFGVGKSKNSI